jgi:hypothetical protein
MLEQFIQQFGISVPATIHQKIDRTQRQGTFLPKDADQPIVIDCIAHSPDIVTTDDSVGQPDWDALAKAHDHFPMAAQITIPTTLTPIAPKRRVPTYSRTDVGNPEQDRHFQHLVDALPIIPQFVEPTSQTFVFNEWVRTAAEAAYPTRQSKPKKQCTTEETLAIIKQRNATAHNRAWTRKLIQKAPMRSTFGFWARRSPNMIWSVVQAFVPKGTPARLVKLSRQMKDLFKKANMSAKNDLNKWLQNQQNKVDAAVELGDVRTLQTFIASNHPYKPRPQVAIITDNGKVCTDDPECQEAFAEHFARLMAGTRTNFATVVDAVWEDAVQALQHRNLTTDNPTKTQHQTPNSRQIPKA